MLTRIPMAVSLRDGQRLQGGAGGVPAVGNRTHRVRRAQAGECRQSTSAVRGVSSAYPEGTMLKEGDRTPAVTGTSYDGRTFDLGAPGMPTVLYFYPKANTSG